jgi:ubiquinone/menaquinone biosynthesis C-methylase UbiE
MEIDKESLNKRNYEKLYEYKYEQKTFEVLSKTMIFKKLIKTISVDNGKVLEIGFGSGNLIKTLLNKKCRYYGMEISQSAIVTAKRKYKDQVEVNLIKKNQIPYDNEFFDLIIMSHSLEHIEEEEKILEEIKRTLKKNGLIIIGVPTPENDENELHFRTYISEDFRRICEELCLQLVQIEGFRQIKLVQKIFEKVALQHKTSTTQKKATAKKIFYYYIISPIISYLYSLNIGRGGCVEYWVVLKNTPTSTQGF